ncbi:Thioesterase/thiol ester dehydrase-isomerase [Glarea lozoyensis ATCC 20868]|uniref:Thioesterase/thiol ester dehydrase-isomerase n=1 Tax=Glarea lozoyensis (strain ATCC 20868 / MF5171) TaxID=1116229 RepID=S3CVR6_GLAL2|nr:Thioesterase/thiol ester dehydrase-isomerase [Glarea lozoyensis ATCC 20868]EPE30507.1 Thioesterase/thiol ester dehydrase-isomerase [Glarea lozoyensis ATCC 20868]
MPSPTATHNQPTPFPLTHFHSIPWCHALLTQKHILHTSTPDRTPLPSAEAVLVRETLNTPHTVRACVTYLRYLGRPNESVGETKARPFLECAALLDLGLGVSGFAKTAHGGVLAVMLDEVLGTAANMQAEKGAYTASLKINFKRPVKLPQVVLVRGRVERVEGKKIFVKGTVEDSEGVVMGEGEALFVDVGREIGRWTSQEEKEEKEREREGWAKL